MGSKSKYFGVTLEARRELVLKLERRARRMWLAKPTPHRVYRHYSLCRILDRIEQELRSLPLRPQFLNRRVA